MNTSDRDPIVASLARLAEFADEETFADRLPDIQRRVRATRRRHVAGVAVLTVLAAGVGLGAWRALPSQQSVPPITGDPVWQRAEIRADALGADHLAISIDFIGEALPYRTRSGVERVGPTSFEVLIDGRPTTRWSADTDDCGSGDDLQAYRRGFYADRALVVPVDGQGRHTVEVRSTTCSAGEPVDATEKVSVVTRDNATDEQTERADLDGDGGDEQGVPDLDDDGRQELVVVLSGGDASIGRVYVADRTSEPKLTLVQAVDADGQKAELSTDASVGADAWQVTYLPEGIYSLRANSAEPGAPPYDVQVRRWDLSGTTLTESSEQTVGCWESQGESFGLWLGRC